MRRGVAAVAVVLTAVTFGAASAASADASVRICRPHHCDNG